MVIAIHLQPEGHIGGIRTNIRKAAQVHVASHYGLMKGANERVADLLKNNAYIYPANTKVHLPCILSWSWLSHTLQGDPIWTKLFQLPAILNTIEDAFFNDKLTAGVKWHGHLTSTFEDHPNEAELPITMVVFAITAVCFCLLWVCYILMNHTIQGMLHHHAVLHRKIRPRFQLRNVWQDLSNIGQHIEWHLQSEQMQISCTHALII